ncbi:MAG: DUF952 domain-containing protein [Microvirga sp.]
MTHIYKICSARLWQDAEERGFLPGSPDDIRDGFIHFSTAAQVVETVARHFAGRTDLVIVAVDATALGDALRYEPSRGGDLFPHLYGPLAVAAATWARPLPLDADGRHAFPDLVP